MEYYTFPKVTTRADLRNLPFQNKVKIIVRTVENIADHVIQAAGMGKTELIVETTPEKLVTQYGHCSLEYIPIINAEEILEALRIRLPGCDAEFVTEWVDVPNRRGGAPMRELKSLLRIDWS